MVEDGLCACWKDCGAESEKREMMPVQKAGQGLNN